MGEEGGVAIAEALLVNRSLITLKSNHLGAKGAKIIGDVLKANHVLQTLEAPSNGVGSVGAKHIAEGLRESKALISLKYAATCPFSCRQGPLTPPRHQSCQNGPD